MSDSPIQFFEESIRALEESSSATESVSVDRILSFSGADSDRLFRILAEKYPAGHWASERANFQCSMDITAQLLAVNLGSLKQADLTSSSVSNCCARIVNAPTLSPYIVRRNFNYIVIPVGFISSVEKFVSTTYAMATAVANAEDPDQRTHYWDRDFFTMNLWKLAESDPNLLTHGTLEASIESVLQQVVKDFDDHLVFQGAFKRSLYAEVLQMMPSSRSWDSYGFRDLGTALTDFEQIRSHARKLTILSICLAVCHEFGHFFAFSVDAEGILDLKTNEGLADRLGILSLHRLIELRVVDDIIGSRVTDQDLCDALVCFHTWSLSKEIGSLLANPGGTIEPEFDRISAVAERWNECVSLVEELWDEKISAFGSGDGISVGKSVATSWSAMAAGLLRAALARNGYPASMHAAGAMLPDLAERGSKLYEFLKGRSEESERGA